jgi:hypothetical protein
MRYTQKRRPALSAIYENGSPVKAHLFLLALFRGDEVAVKL